MLHDALAALQLMLHDAHDARGALIGAYGAIYGPYMAHIWAIHGPYMDHIWPAYMDHMLSIYGPYKFVQSWDLGLMVSSVMTFAQVERTRYQEGVHNLPRNKQSKAKRSGAEHSKE